ncbi:MAG: hypothetical protein ACXVC1_05250 [Tumebacillaceae bacterium]
MKKSMMLMAATALTAQLLSVGVANAAYDPTLDQSINVTSPISLPNLGTGQLTYQVQQSVLGSVTSAVGVKYYYYWVNVNGTPVLAVDPPCPMF